MHPRILPIALAVCCALALASTPSEAVEAEYDLGFSSAYVWRGLTVVDGAVFQPSITISHESGFSFNTWGNYDIDDVNDRSGEFSEIDLTASYAFPTDGTFGAEIGYIEYLFPNSGGFNDATSELYVGLSWDVTAAPFVTVYYDFDQVEDFYVNFGIGFGGDFNDSTSWELSLAAAWVGEDFAAFYAGGTDGGLFDGNATFSVSTSLADKWSLGAYAAYTTNLDQDVMPDQDVDFYGGISITGSF